MRQIFGVALAGMVLLGLASTSGAQVNVTVATPYAGGQPMMGQPMAASPAYVDQAVTQTTYGAPAMAPMAYTQATTTYALPAPVYSTTTYPAYTTTTYARGYAMRRGPWRYFMPRRMYRAY